jgi:hypothetical protein
MSDDPNAVPLLKYIDRVLDERDKRFGERFEAQQAALKEVKESYNADKRQANEWRGTLNDRDSH